MFKRPRVLLVLLAVGLALPAVALAAKNGWWNSPPVGPILSAIFSEVEVEEGKLTIISPNGYKHKTTKLKLRANSPITATVDATAQTITIPNFELVKNGSVSILVDLTPDPLPLTPGWKSWTFANTPTGTPPGTRPSTAAINSGTPIPLTVCGRIEKDGKEYELELEFFGTSTATNGTGNIVVSSQSNGTTVVVLRVELEGETKPIVNGIPAP